MSLNCLTCSQMLHRTESFQEFFTEKEYKEACERVDRSWSGNISPPTPKSEASKSGALAKVKAKHRRVQSTGNVPYPGNSKPKLMRSSGMRRDWSFENLNEQQDQIVSCH